MKTAKEIYESVYHVVASTDDGPLNYPVIMEKAMIEYAKQVIDEILTKHMTPDQMYASSGELWCRVEVEPVKELKEKLK